MLDDLALVDPHLHADDPVGRTRNAVAEVDVGTQRVQRHAALAVPLDAGNLGAAETAGDVDTNALRTKTQRRLHGALHGAAEGHAALELLGDRLGDQRRIDLGLAHLDDVEMHFRLRKARELAAQLLDVGALLADQDARTRGVHGHPALLVRALDHDLRDASLALHLQDVLAHLPVFVQQLAVLTAAREPAAVPGPVDADAQADGIDLVAHQAASSAVFSASALAAASRTITVSCENGFMIPPERPRPRAWKRFMTRFLPTKASETTRSSTSRP